MIETSERFFNEYADHRETPRSLGILAIAYYHTGESSKTMEIIERLKEYRHRTSAGSPSFYLAMIYAQMGEIDTAFEWLNKAYEDHKVEMYWLKVEPPFAPLHDDPRWEQCWIRWDFRSK